MPYREQTDAAERNVFPLLMEMAQQYAPDYDPVRVAEILLSPDRGEEFDALVQQLDDRIPASAVGHIEGITDSERNGGYSLGPGDQKVYAALRASNLMNAAIGRQAVPSAQHLVGGGNYGVDGEYNPVYDEPHATDWIEDINRGGKLNRAAGYYKAAAADPTHHSTFFSTHYPEQHSFWQLDNNGDSNIAQALSWMNLSPTASMRASRKDQPDLVNTKYEDIPFMPNAGAKLVGNVANQLYKWGGNILGGLDDSYTHERARTEAGRASVPVPEGLSPEQRSQYAGALRGLVEPSKAPAIKDYGHAKGVTYSDMGAFGADLSHEIVDPSTVVSGGWGMLKGLAGAGVKALGGVLAREAATEVLNPLNVAAAAVTMPKTFDSLYVPPASTIPEDAKDQYAQQEADRQQALKDAKVLQSRRPTESWLPAGGIIGPHGW